MPPSVIRWLSNPHYLAGALVARAASTVATLIFAVELLVLNPALSLPRYQGILLREHEDPIALGLLAVALFQLWALLTWRAHGLWVILASGVVAIHWTYAMVAFVIYAPGISIFGFPCVIMIAGLAWWSFLAWPRRGTS